MAIPDTEVRLFKGIPWDNTYKDVRLFDDATQRDSYFKDSGDRFVRKFVDFTYQRVEGRDTIKVGIHADKIRNVNYIGFKNSTLNKWFYAFVNGVNYVNPNCTEIVYELDHFQNWFYAVKSSKGMPICPLLRRHSTYEEELFASTPQASASPLFTSPERLTPSMYVANQEQSDYLLIGNGQFEDLHLYLSILVSGLPSQRLSDIYKALGGGDDEEAEEKGKVIAENHRTSLGYNEFKSFGKMGAGSLWQFRMSSAQDLEYYRRFMRVLSITPASYGAQVSTDSLLSRAVIAAYISPAEYSVAQQINDAVNGTIVTSKKCKLAPLSPWGKGNGNEDYGYIPTNNKLKYYPYRKIIVQSFSGQGEEIQPEYFSPDSLGQAQFYMRITPLEGPRITLKPIFRGLSNDSMFIDFKCDNDISYMDNPVGLAIKKGTDFNPLLEAARTTTGIVGSLTSGGGSYSAVSTVANQALGRIMGGVESIEGAGYQPTTVYGNNGSSDNAWLFDRLGFLIYPVSPTWQEGKNIDKYFDYYGYNASGENRSPLDVLYNRTLWDYVQTANCLVVADIPQDSKKVIEAIFDAGARFWHKEPDYNISERNLCVGQPEPQPVPDPIEEEGLKIENLYIPSVNFFTPAFNFGDLNTDLESDRQLHCGTDYGASLGTQLHPIGRGKVVRTGSDSTRGNYVEIEHSYEYRKSNASSFKTYYIYSVYMHLSVVNVSKGQTVDRRDVIGTTGQSGQVSAPHLHLGIYATKEKGSELGAGYLHNDIKRSTTWLHDENFTPTNYYINFEEIVADVGGSSTQTSEKLLPILKKTGIFDE